MEERVTRSLLLALAQTLNTQTFNLSLFLATWAKMGLLVRPLANEAIMDFHKEMRQFLDDLGNERLTDQQVFDIFRAANNRYNEVLMIFREEAERLVREMEGGTNLP